MTIVKPCIKCGAADRYANGHCRPCAKARSAAWTAANPERKRAMNSEWNVAHPGRMKELTYAWNAANTLRRNEITATWKAANIERMKVMNAAYRAANPEMISAWKAANPENCKASDHKRRARKRAAGGSFTATDIHAMLRRQREKCVVCRVDISKNYHIDHIMPLALEGSNGIENIQLLCPTCNMSKHASHPITFMQSRGFLL